MRNAYTQQISEVPALSPAADLQEVLRWAMYVQQWMRTREPVSSGEALQKFATRQELLQAGLVNYSAGTANGSAEAFTVHPDLITPSTATLTLSATRRSFEFDDAVDTTSADPDITFTADLGGVPGFATFTAVAYDANHLPLGAAPLTNLTATTADLSATDFVNGLGTSVRYVKLVATFNGLIGYLYVYRTEAGVADRIVDISSRYHLVTTSQSGGNGDFSAVGADILLYRGATDETALWEFAITTTNCTALINNEAGPITGATTIKVAITGLSASAGNVLITATRATHPTQTATIEVAKIGFRP